MQSRLLHDLVQGALQKVPPVVFQKCSGLVSDKTTLQVLKPMSFNADGGPKSGAWIVRIPVSGCGNDTTLNIHFSAQAGKNINYTVMLPGDTRADIPLQRDALMYASVGARRLTKDCEDIEIIDTKFDGFGLSKSPDPDAGAQDSKRPWRRHGRSPAAATRWMCRRSSFRTQPARKSFNPTAPLNVAEQ
jgi:hypothetical protein